MKGFQRSGIAVMVVVALLFATSVQAQSQQAKPQQAQSQQAKPQQAKPQQATAAQVHELLQVMGTEHLMHGAMEQMLQRMDAMLTSELPCVPASYWQGFADEQAQKQLIGRIVPIYQHHFTRQDVKDLLKFYRTPLGQKVIHEMPEAMREAMQAGSEWGKTRMREMLAKLKQQGTLNDEGKCPAPGAQGKLGGK